MTNDVLNEAKEASTRVTHLLHETLYTNNVGDADAMSALATLLLNMFICHGASEESISEMCACFDKCAGQIGGQHQSFVTEKVNGI